MSKPLLSGFCNPDNPPTSHGRCRLDGCTCSCHQLAVDSGSAPRVKVSLACLQGRHTETCGHLEDDAARPVHNHTWQPLADPHGIYQGKARVCTGPLGGGCGATMDARRVYPFGETPPPAGAVCDDLTPPGFQLTIDPTPIVELTVTERARVIAAHSVLDPSAALEVARALISERMTP